ncbi:M16 family metallopeptidase [Actibacterium sp. XHP0104]|uniref:M16 family metallopeptidase n=1 Tax=Actibacterium sp. XHP0104 TaxID=2984335 RepID=UPI0021E94464|nr:pitrilysin family protein [Actibacterium sp. XHP0104]MCV2881920.1 insulinase family protein [Actibacterium sp. XHP0104]
MMRLSRLLVATCSLFLAGAGAGRADDVTSFTLDNGMQVVVIEDHRAPVVVHMVWYRVGSADEPPGKSGLAHFTEHLMFKGTDSFPEGAFSDLVEANGGSDNAFTSYDYTGYHQRVAADRLALMMEMEADRMTGLTLGEAEVLTERDVILEERNQRTENSPGALFTEQRNAVQYVNHPYGIPVIGWRAEMEGLTRADALEFYRRHYAPNNAILVVAGDVTPDDVRALADTYYGPIAPSDAVTPRARPQEPPQRAERRLTLADARVAQPYLVRSYLAPERDPGDQKTAAALVYLAELLGGEGATSLLGQKLMFEEPTALYTAAWYSGTSLDDTTFGMIVVPSPEVPLQEAEARMDAVIAEFMETGVDLALFESLKMQLRASNIYEKDSVAGLAQKYGQALAVGLTVEDVQAWPDVLQAVTPDDVMDAARMVFDRRASVTGWLVREETQ